MVPLMVNQRRQLADCWHVCCDSLDACVDITVRKLEPLYAVLAGCLVLLDAYIFFTTVIHKVWKTEGVVAVTAHVAVALWLLFNVLFNHAKCMFTDPGTTKQFPLEVLHQHMTHDWKWCRKCNLPKPPLAHHCSICGRCVLRMDHHCPFMVNCVGFGNYKYFFLYLYWMWVGSLYSAVMLYSNLGGMRAFGPNYRRLLRQSVFPFFMFVLSCSMVLGIGGLMGWHVLLICTGQGTIEFLDSRARKASAEDRNLVASNPYHLGAVANWKHIFDAFGRFWWLTWMLPSWQVKQGNGLSFPRTNNSSIHQTSHHVQFSTHQYV